MTEFINIHTLGQNTPIYLYPKLINENFNSLRDEISLFYNIKGSTFTDKGSGRCINAPISNEKVESNVASFKELLVDSLIINKELIITNPNDNPSSELCFKRNFNTNDFYIDSETGTISIRNPIEKDINTTAELNKKNNIVIDFSQSIYNLSLDSTSSNTSYNIALGDNSLKELFDGKGNIVIGHHSGEAISKGDGNIILGSGICNDSEVFSNKFYVGNSNVGIFLYGDMMSGELGLSNPKAFISYMYDISILSKGEGNIIIGKNEINNISHLTGVDNILIGSDISSTITSGDNNIFIGSNSAYRFYDNINYILCIGVVDTEKGITDPIICGDMKKAHITFNTKTTEFKGGIKVSSNIKHSHSYTTIGLDSSNNIVKISDSDRYKTNIKSLKKECSKKIYNIECVTYEPTETDGREYLGFIAEEVEKVDKRLVSYTNINGVETVDSVLYDRFVVHLLNEVKQHEETIKYLSLKVEELSNKIK